MFFALRIMLSDQFAGWLLENHELLVLGYHDDEELEGHHDELELLIEGNQDDDEEPDGIQSDESDEEKDGSIAEPIIAPTPSPMPNTANTVEMG